MVYALVNQGNIRTLTKELLDYLRISDSEFKPDLTNKICMLVQRFAPDKRWHLDSLMQACTPHLHSLHLMRSRSCLVLVSYLQRGLLFLAFGGMKRSLLRLDVSCIMFLDAF